MRAMMVQIPQRDHKPSRNSPTLSYAPTIPSPLNPQPSAQRSPSHPSVPFISPKPQVRRKSSRNVSPTQRLLRQKAQIAWRSQTRYNTIVSSEEETSCLVMRSKHTRIQGQNHQREGAWVGSASEGDVGDSKMNKDTSLHPSMLALIENLAKENPIIVSATANPYAPPMPLDFDTDFGLPTWNRDACDNEKTIDGNATYASNANLNLGLGISFGLPSFASRFGSTPSTSQSQDDEFDEKDALIPTSTSRDVSEDAQFETMVHAGYSTVEDPLAPLLPLHSGHLRALTDTSEPTPERMWDATTRRLLLAITLITFLCLYPLISLLPQVRSGFEFV